LRSWEQECPCGGGPRLKNGGLCKKRPGVVGHNLLHLGGSQINLGGGGGGPPRGLLLRHTAYHTGAAMLPTLCEPAEGDFCAGARGGMQQIQLSPNLPPPALHLCGLAVRGGGPHAHFPGTAEFRSVISAGSCRPAVSKGLGHAARCHGCCTAKRGGSRLKRMGLVFAELTGFPRRPLAEWSPPMPTSTRQSPALAVVVSSAAPL